MKQMSKYLMLVILASVLGGCKLFVTVGEGGSITGTGGNDCSGNSVCEIDITDTSFSESFTAIPATGYVFLRWEEGDAFLCGNSTSTTCALSNAGFSGNTAIEAIIATDRAFAIRPIFEPVSGYLGMTSGNYDGSPLITGWTAACQAEYGSQAVVCNTKQIFDSPGLANAAPPTSGMWIRPYFSYQNGTYSGADISGIYAFCQSNSSGHKGSALISSLDTIEVSCDIARPIACCR